MNKKSLLLLAALLLVPLLATVTVIYAASYFPVFTFRTQEVSSDNKEKCVGCRKVVAAAQTGTITSVNAAGQVQVNNNA